jgi:beta-lactamase regulating signal transducer with metallopeptidase domain
MNPAFAWLAPWLAEFLIAATVLLAAAILARAMLRQPAARLAVAWSTCVGILLLAVLLAWRDRPRLALELVASHSGAAAPTAPPEPLSATNSELNTVATLPSIVETDAAVITEPVEMTPAAEKVPAVEIVAIENTDNRGDVSQQRLFVPWRELLSGVWLAMAGAMLLWIGLGAYRARRLLATAIRVPEWIQAELNRICGKSRQPGLWASPRVTTAVALGAAAPQIILPAGLEKSQVAAVRAALAHEWAHIRHGDLWLLALERLLLPLLAWHPLFWWLRRGVRLDQELLADAAAAGSEPAEYAEALLVWAKDAKQPRHGLVALAMWEHPSTLSRRVAMLLDPRRPVAGRISRWYWAAAAGAILPALAALSTLSLGPAEAQEPAAADELRVTSGDGVTVELAVDKPAAPEQVQTEQAQPVQSQPQPAPPLPEAAKVVLTQIHLELVVMRASRAKLAAADTSLEDEIAAATDSRCQREAGLVTAQITEAEVAALTKSLQEKDAVSVLSRPSLITLDGREAMVQSGGKHPTLWVEESINGKHEERLEYQEFGTHLLVTPRQLADKPGWLSLLVEAQQSELIRPSPYTNDGGPPANVPGIVSRKFRLNTEVEIGKSLLVAESPTKPAGGKEPQRDQFLLILKPSKVTLEASAIYSDPGAAERAQAGAAARLSDETAARSTTVGNSTTSPTAESRRLTIYRLHQSPPFDLAARFKEHMLRKGVAPDQVHIDGDASTLRVESSNKDLHSLVVKFLSEYGPVEVEKITEESSPPSKSAGRSIAQPPVEVAAAEESPARVTATFKLRHTDAKGAAEHIRTIFADDRSLVVELEPATNSVIVSTAQGSRAQIEALVGILDRPAASAAPAAPQRSASLELRLLELDRAEAEATLQVAEAELQSNEEIQRKHPGAVSQTELRKFQGMVDRAKIQLERIKLKLEAARAEEPALPSALQRQ